MLRVRQEGWTQGTGSQILFLPLSTTSPMTLDKFQRHQIFRQFLLPFGPGFTQAEPGVGRLESQNPVNASVPHLSEGHHQGCLSATPFPADFSEVLGWEGDASHLCSSLEAGGKSLTSRMAWLRGAGGGSGREAIKKTLLRNQTEVLGVCTGWRVDSQVPFPQGRSDTPFRHSKNLPG